MHFLEKKRANKSAMKPCPIDTKYTIFDALLETLQKKEKKNSGYLSLFKHFCSPMNLATLLLMAIGLVTICLGGQFILVRHNLLGKRHLLDIIRFQNRRRHQLGNRNESNSLPTNGCGTSFFRLFYANQKPKNTRYEVTRKLWFVSV